MKPSRVDQTARFKIASAIVLLLVAIAPGAARGEPPRQVSIGFSQEGLARVREYMRNEISTGGIPGAVLLVQQHGQPVLFESFGVRDVDSGRAMTSDTIFRL